MKKLRTLLSNICYSMQAIIQTINNGNINFAFLCDNSHMMCFNTSMNYANELIDVGSIKGEIFLDTIIAGAGNSKVAILLHGFPETNFSWRFQIPFLASLGYEVYAPNLRGYGQSSKPVGVQNYSIDKLTDDVAGLIDKVANGRQITLIGHDWGAAVAWAFAIMKKRPIEHLINMNVPHPAKMREGLRTWKQIKKSWYIFFFQIPWLPEQRLLANEGEAIAKMFRGSCSDKNNFTDEVCDVYRKNVLIPGNLTAMINYYRAAFRALMAKSTGALPILKTPTLLIWGDADIALGIELTEGYETLVQNFTLKKLSGISHWVQQEAPNEVNNLIGEWLKDQK